jgi:peroxiredoxin
MTLTACLTLAFAFVAPPEAKPLALGDMAPNLRFKDIRYLPRSLDDFGKKQAYVLVFTGTRCPLVQRYLPVLQRLETEFRGKEVQFVAVNVCPEDGILEIATQAIKHDVEFPFVKDHEGAAARLLGVQRTPEVVVLDAERRLRYRGRIDDQYRLGGARPAATRHDLREALVDLLAKREVSVKETTVDGCVIAAAPRLPEPAKPITYADHVAPIVRKHCVECHRPQTAAPFSLLTYGQTAARAETIAEVVRDGRMPPWFASLEHGTFVNRRGLTANERDVILQWVRGGKLQGDESKLPPLDASVEKPADWKIGKPDLVFPVTPHELPAEGLVPYKYTILPHIFLEDTWVQGIEIRADNPRVLHHCNMAYVTAEKGFKMSNFLTGTVPGGEPMLVGDGVAVLIPKGAMLGLQIHYVTTGKPEKCRISVGLKYADGAVNQRLRFLLLADNKYAIPPHAPAHKVTAAKELDCDAVGVGLFVHMHLRGRDMTFRAHRPGVDAETLLIVPNYNFDWQMPYRWQTGVMKFPKGTRMEAVARYDNSAFNPYNPDPAATVRDGLQTHQEMMNGFFFYVDANEKLGLRIDGKTGRAR